MSCGAVGALCIRAYIVIYSTWGCCSGPSTASPDALVFPRELLPHVARLGLLVCGVRSFHIVFARSLQYFRFFSYSAGDIWNFIRARLRGFSLPSFSLCCTCYLFTVFAIFH